MIKYVPPYRLQVYELIMIEHQVFIRVFALILFTV